MRKTRTDRIAGLGELQIQVLEALSRLGEGTVYDVLAEFPEAERPRYTTILTVLRALEKKGLVSHRTENRAYVFRPETEPQQVRRQVVKDVVERVFGGSYRELVLSLVDSADVTPETLAELKALIAKQQRKRRRG